MGLYEDLIESHKAGERARIKKLCEDIKYELIQQASCSTRLYHTLDTLSDAQAVMKLLITEDPKLNDHISIKDKTIMISFEF